MSSHPFSLDALRRRLLAAAPASAGFGFQGLRSTDCISVETCLPLDFLIACDWGLDGADWERRLRYFCLERHERKRIVWTHSALVEGYAGKLGREIRDYLAAENRPFFIVPYRETEFLAQLAAEGGRRVSLLANPLPLKTSLDDKIAFREEALRANLPLTPGEIAEVGSLGEGLFKKWGTPIIVTERIGSSGNQTHAVNSPAELEELKTFLRNKYGEESRVIVCRYLEGHAVGATGFVLRGKARMSHPSVMMTGLAGCAMHRFDYAGSDYAAYGRLPEEIRKQIEHMTLAFGDWIASRGYRGIYGVDFLVHGDQAHALELNPRLLGTTQLLTELEMRDGSSPPSVYWHLCEFLGVEPEPETDETLIAGAGVTRLQGFQLLLRNTRSVPVRIGRVVMPGVYKMTDEGPSFLREGNRIAALEGPDEVLVTCSPPARDMVVAPRGVFFKIEGIGSVYEAGRQVSEAGAKMVNAFLNALETSEPG